MLVNFSGLRSVQRALACADVCGRRRCTNFIRLLCKVSIKLGEKIYICYSIVSLAAELKKFNRRHGNKLAASFTSMYCTYRDILPTLTLAILVLIVYNKLPSSCDSYVLRNMW
jgi:hypothetical protein